MQLVKAQRGEEAAALLSFAPVFKTEALKRKPQAERVLRIRDVNQLVSFKVVEMRLQAAEAHLSAAGGAARAPELAETHALLTRKLAERKQAFGSNPPVSTWDYVGQLQRSIDAALAASGPAPVSGSPAAHELQLMQQELVWFKQQLEQVPAPN